MGNLLVSFTSVVKIAFAGMGRKKVKVAAKNVSGSRQDTLHEELIHPRRNHQAQRKKLYLGPELRNASVVFCPSSAPGKVISKCLVW